MHGQKINDSVCHAYNENVITLSNGSRFCLKHLEVNLEC